MSRITPKPGMTVEISMQGIEKSRLDAIEAAESMRKANEVERANAELMRKEDEAGRITAEQERTMEEDARNLAESGRILAEESRVAAENLRSNGEQSRVEAEKGRSIAESGRANAEALRHQTFETNEANRHTAFESAENARESEWTEIKSNVESSVGLAVVDAVDAAKNANSAAESANAAAEKSVRYDEAQTLSDAQKAQARGNIDAADKESVDALKGDLDSKPQFGDLYDGVDLTVTHADEIDGYASPWSWIKARIAAGNFSQLHVSDYIPFTTTNGRTFKAQIAGINTYKGYGDSEIGNHIDFITREIWPDAFQMNTANFNNGTSSDKQVPWLASNGYLFVNSLAGQVPNSNTKPLEMADVDYTSGGIYFYLPDDLKAVIIEKRIWAQTRFSDSGILTNDNGGAWVNAGKLWLPDEFEVTGARLMTTMGWFCGGYVQYPIFAHRMIRAKRANGSRKPWWLSSALGNNSINFVFVNSLGVVYNYDASNALRAPICFRIG